MEQQTTPSMTGKQKRDIRRLLNDVLDGMGFGRDAAQRILGNGGRLKTRVRELLAELSASDLLEAVGTATTPAIATFRVKEYFNDDCSGPVKIGWIGYDFRKAFLAGDGLVEGAVNETTLRIHKLVKVSVDAPILAELGEAVAETSLAQMYELMKAQGQGQQSILLTNGYANIFYVRDSNNVLWAACCYWGSGYDYWYVYARPVTVPPTWCAGYQVFSR